METEAEKIETKRRERKQRMKDIKEKFLQEQMQKKNRKHELEQKLGLVDDKSKSPPVAKNRRHDTDSDSDDNSEDEQTKKTVAPKQTKLDNAKSGLQTAEDLKKEIEANKQSNIMDEADAFDQLKAQKAVIRGKDGAILDSSQLQKVGTTKDKIKQMNLDRLSMWSKGVVQTQKRQGQAADGEDDIKQRDWFGDPMNEIRKYKKGEATDKDKRVLWSRKLFPP